MPTAMELVETWHAEWLGAPKPHWGDSISWTTAEQIARRIDRAQAPEPKSCELVIGDWYCTKQAGHPGECRPVPRES